MCKYKGTSTLYKFIEKSVKDKGKVVDTIYNGGAERDEVKLEIISGSQGAQNA